METPYEKYETDPALLQQVRKAANGANTVLLQLLEARQLDPGMSYHDILNNPNLMRLFVEGSHQHELDGAPDIREAWRSKREFIAHAISSPGTPSVLDVGSSNGLFLKTVEGVGAPIIPYGLDRNDLENQVARLLFPAFEHHFITIDLTSASNYQSPQDLAPEFPDKFDVIYWAVWSKQGDFADLEGKMPKLLFMFSHWTENEGGRLLLGFYDRPRDEEHKNNLRSMGVYPRHEAWGPTHNESMWEVDPRQVIKALGSLVGEYEGK